MGWSVMWIPALLAIKDQAGQQTADIFDFSVHGEYL